MTKHLQMKPMLQMQLLLQRIEAAGRQPTSASGAVRFQQPGGSLCWRRPGGDGTGLVAGLMR